MTARSPWIITTDDHDVPIYNFKIRAEVRKDRVRAVAQSLLDPKITEKFPWVSRKDAHKLSRLELMNIAFELSDTVIEWAEKNMPKNK